MLCKQIESPRLVDASRNECVVVDAALISHRFVGQGIFGTKKVKQLLGVAPGVCQAVSEDAEGIYFRGAGHPVTYRTGDTIIRYAGGIWIPNAGNTKPQLYTYFGSGQMSSAASGAPTAQDLIGDRSANDPSLRGSIGQVALLGVVADTTAAFVDWGKDGKLALWDELEFGDLLSGLEQAQQKKKYQAPGESCPGTPVSESPAGK